MPEGYARRKKEALAPEEKVSMADVRPTKKMADRLQGDGMNARLKKVAQTAAVGATLISSTLIPTKTFEATLARQMHAKEKAYSSASQLMKSSMIEAAIQPIAGSDTAQIQIGAKNYIWKANAALEKLGLSQFPKDAVELKLASGQHLLLTSAGVIYIKGLEEKAGGVEVDQGVIRTKEPLDAKAAWIDNNGVFALLNRGTQKTELLVVDQRNSELSAHDLTEAFQGVTSTKFKLYVDVEKPMDRDIFVTHQVNGEEKLLGGLAIDRNKILLAGL